MRCAVHWHLTQCPMGRRRAENTRAFARKWDNDAVFLFWSTDKDVSDFFGTSTEKFWSRRWSPLKLGCSKKRKWGSSHKDKSPFTFQIHLVPKAKRRSLPIPFVLWAGNIVMPVVGCCLQWAPDNHTLKILWCIKHQETSNRLPRLFHRLKAAQKLRDAVCRLVRLQNTSKTSAMKSVLLQAGKGFPCLSLKCLVWPLVLQWSHQQKEAFLSAGKMLSYLKFTYQRASVPCRQFVRCQKTCRCSVAVACHCEVTLTFSQLRLFADGKTTQDVKSWVRFIEMNWWSTRLSIFFTAHLTPVAETLEAKLSAVQSRLGLTSCSP